MFYHDVAQKVLGISRATKKGKIFSKRRVIKVFSESAIELVFVTKFADTENPSGV